jgi:hypothetical protein
MMTITTTLRPVNINNYVDSHHKHHNLYQHHWPACTWEYSCYNFREKSIGVMTSQKKIGVGIKRFMKLFYSYFQSIMRDISFFLFIQSAQKGHARKENNIQIEKVFFTT